MSAFDNSGILDVHKWSEYPEVNSAVDFIYEEISPMLKIKEALQKKHIKVVILDLWAKWLTDPTMYVAYSRNRNNYKAKSRYNSLHISFKIVLVIDALIEMKYVTHKKGFRDTRSGISRDSRIRATNKLIKLIDKSKCTPEMIQTAPDTECIILRMKQKVKNSKGKLVEKNIDLEYGDTDQTRIWRSHLCEYNDLLFRTHIDIPGFPAKGVWNKSKTKQIKIDHSSKFVRRVFNNSSWEEGGRFYGGWWQNIPKEWRGKIEINRFPTVELDYKGLHIVLLYALEEIDYWKEIEKDPYRIKGYPETDEMRAFLKVVLLTIINCENKKQAIKSVRKSIVDEFKWFKKEMNWEKSTDKNIEKLLDDFTAPHEKIKEYFYSGFGVKLQNMDSRMAERIVCWLASKCDLELPVLCLHDGFIVKEDDRREVKYQMAKSFDLLIKEIRNETRFPGGRLKYETEIKESTEEKNYVSLMNYIIEHRRGVREFIKKNNQRKKKK